jgi:hypothetical protein
MMPITNLALHFALPRKASQRLAKMRENRANKKNVQLIKTYLKIRKKQHSADTNQFVLLDEQRNNGTVDKDTYERLRTLLLMSNELKQVEMATGIRDKD